ncbi:MAG: hypothetical protein IJV14_05070 [Lachnospiraceae bacterium]|nr:hypothetical protein [Lachnospiraceae bacterium]
MTYQDIVSMTEETGLPSAYDHFAEGQSPDPPFLLFLLPGDDNFSADGSPYLKVTVVHFELYTDYKDPELEKRIEAVLEGHGLFYDKSEVWIESEKLYEVLYEMEVAYE